MGGGGGTPMGGRVGVPTITCRSSALPCPCYNHHTNLLEIQMQTVRNAASVALLIIGAIAVVFVGPAMGMHPGMWIVMGGLVSIGLAALVADV